MDTKENAETNQKNLRKELLKQTTAEQVDELTSEHTGRWLVTTKSTLHLWDLDAMTYVRMPSEDSKSGSMENDERAVRIGRVVWWPKVGKRPYFWFDDPESPMFFEHWRINSEVQKIERLSDMKDGRHLRGAVMMRRIPAQGRRPASMSVEPSTLKVMSSIDPVYETDIAPPEVSVAIAGDWHANISWALRCLKHLRSLGVREIFQLGDFGIWPGQKGADYLDALQQTLEELDMRIVVTPGNHEDYHQIARLPVEDRDNNDVHGGFEPLGAVQWARNRIALLPRVHRFSRAGWSFVSLGGAPSVDFEHRIPGESWWLEEMITDDDVATVVTGGPADVMLTHDAPEPWHGTDMVAKIIQTPLGRSAEVLAYAAEGRRRLDEAFQAVKPRVLAHGHYHVKDQKVLHIEGWSHETVVVSTGCDDMPDANLALLHLPQKDSAELPVPRVQWLPLPPVTRGVDRSQLGIWPEKPLWAWETEEFQKVFDEGRSAHWNQLIAEAAQEPQGAWVHRMTEALQQSQNARAREFWASRAGGLLPGTVEDGGHR